MVMVIFTSLNQTLILGLFRNFHIGWEEQPIWFAKFLQIHPRYFTAICSSIYLQGKFVLYVYFSTQVCGNTFKLFVCISFSSVRGMTVFSMFIKDVIVSFLFLFFGKTTNILIFTLLKWKTAVYLCDGSGICYPFPRLARQVKHTKTAGKMMSYHLSLCNIKD